MRPVRVSTIVWGVLLLLLASAAFAVSALDVDLFSRAIIAYVVVGLGALLVIAAIAGAIARSVKPAVRAEPAVPVEPTVPVEAVETPAEPTAEKPATKPRATASTSSTRKKDQPVD